MLQLAHYSEINITQMGKIFRNVCYYFLKCENIGVFCQLWVVEWSGYIGTGNADYAFKYYNSTGYASGARDYVIPAQSRCCLPTSESNLNYNVTKCPYTWADGKELDSSRGKYNYLLIKRVIPLSRCYARF